MIEADSKNFKQVAFTSNGIAYDIGAMYYVDGTHLTHLVWEKHRPLWHIYLSNASQSQELSALYAFDGNLVNSIVPTLEHESASFQFAGWCYDKDLTTSVKDTDAVSSDLILYAKWNTQA